MKTFDAILEEQFKKLVPYEPLTAPEKAAIILTNREWLTQNPTIRCREREHCIIKGIKCLTCSHGYQVTINLQPLLEELNR